MKVLCLLTGDAVLDPVVMTPDLPLESYLLTFQTHKALGRVTLMLRNHPVSP